MSLMPAADAAASPDATAREDVASAGSLTDSVWAKIREDILTGALEPGARITIEFLKNRYAAGASPIREALWRLCAERFVSSSTNRGFEVTNVFREELVDVIRLRVLLEQQALEEAIYAGTDAWEAEIVACFHRLSKHKQSDGKPWDLWHRRFHEALVATCHAPVLHEMRAQLFDRSSRYRNLTRMVSSRDDLQEHRALMEACLARDVAQAKVLIAQHFELTGRLALDLFDRQRQGQEPA